MDIKNYQGSAGIDDLKREILKRDLIIKEKTGQLRRIYCSNGWRLLVALVSIKKQLCIFMRRIRTFFILCGLFLITFLYTIYLFLLKKLRNITVFPGG